jgi:DNA-binding transcriptional MerR regulator
MTTGDAAAGSAFSTREVAKILGLSEPRLRAWVRVGLVSPGRNGRGRLAFSFRDLLVLKTSKGLVDARIPLPRVRRVLASLRRQLPEGTQLTRLSVYADGDRVVVSDGARRWRPESGQFLFNFHVGSVLRRTGRRPPVTPPRRGLRLNAEQWYDLAAELEAGSPDEAQAAYRQALALDPGLSAAHINLGRLLHAAGDLRGAQEHYRDAARLDPNDPVAAFNLGVLLEDSGQKAEAIRAYERAITADPNFADAHYNLGLLYEDRGRSRDAFRHLRAYKRLTRRPRPQ